MKKILFNLFIFQISLVIVSCQKEEVSVENNINEQNEFEKLKEELSLFTNSFFNDLNEIYYPDISDFGPISEANQIRWKGVFEDYIGATGGFKGGSRIGMKFGGKGKIIGGIVGGVLGGAMLSIDWVEKGPIIFPPGPDAPWDPSRPYSYPIAYQVNKKQPMFYGYVNLNEGNSSLEIDFIAVHNESNPYIELSDYSVIQLGKAEDMGILHNLLIQRIHQDNPDFIFDADIHQIIERVFQEFENLGFDIEMGFPELKEELTAEILRHLGDRNWEDDQDLEFQILREYFDNISLLNTQQAIQYTHEFLNIVANSNVDEFSSIWIRGAISVAVNSKVLWNLNLPSPEDEYLFWVMDENFSHAYIVPWEHTQALMVNNPDYFAGVARIIDCEVTEIYYYKGSSKEMNTGYIESLALSETVITIYEDVLINNGGYIHCDPIMKEGVYQAYQLIRDEEYDYEVYVLKRLD